MGLTGTKKFLDRQNGAMQAAKENLQLNRSHLYKPPVKEKEQQQQESPIGDLDWLADNYNASTKQERNQWKKNAKGWMSKLQTNKITPQAKSNLQELAQVIKDDGPIVFGAELGRTNMDGSTLAEAMLTIYGAETGFGTSKKKVSKSGALGEMQVMDYTFADMVKAGVLGPLYAKAVGLSNKELQSFKPKHRDNGDPYLDASQKKGIKKLLLNNNKANYLAAMGKYLRRKMHSLNNASDPQTAQMVVSSE